LAAAFEAAGGLPLAGLLRSAIEGLGTAKSAQLPDEKLVAESGSVQAFELALRHLEKPSKNHNSSIR
jgi:hypothetical protein